MYLIKLRYRYITIQRVRLNKWVGIEWLFYMRTVSYFGLVGNVTDWRDSSLTRALIPWPQKVALRSVSSELSVAHSTEYVHT